MGGHWALSIGSSQVGVLVYGEGEPGASGLSFGHTLFRVLVGIGDVPEL